MCEYSCNECKKLNRRDFLRRGAAVAGGLAIADPLLHSVASTFAFSGDGTGNLLVLCELSGGMDALSFLAPFQNGHYAQKRPQLALAADKVTALPDNAAYGINNLFPFFINLYQQGQVAIVQQTGYPNPNGSHFESQDIFKYGVRNLGSTVGTSAPWYERLRRTYFDEPFGVMDTATIGDPRNYGYPDHTYRHAAQDAFGKLARLKKGQTTVHQTVLDTYNRIDQTGTQVRARTQAFASTGQSRGEFFRAAALASADLGTQILKVNYGGFDTHGSQDTANANLFPYINNEFQQFVGDLQSLGLWDRTCVVFYSEFGRRNEENGSPGTDHGEGGHMIVVGPRVNGGLLGQNVTTADIDQDSLPTYVDFRAVFGTAIRDWLGFNPNPIFQIEGESFDQDIGGSLFA